MEKCILFFVLLATLFKIEYVSMGKLDNHFATKTPYRFIENNDLNVGFYPECEQKKIWMVVRHGTRYPTVEVMKNIQNQLLPIRNFIIDNQQEENRNLSAEQINNFIKWHPINVPDSHEKYLVSEGEREMYLLGKRMQKRFSKILHDKYDEKKIKLKHTTTQRANESARFFAAGLFGNETKNVKIKSAESKHDPILRFYKKCQKWKKIVKENEDTYKEYFLYANSDEMREALTDMKYKMGLDVDISYEVGKLIYQTCAFETAWNMVTGPSPWCEVFTPSSILPFEYAEDLKYFWQDGYGHDLTSKLPCKLVEDIITFFNNTDGPLSTFYFTHSGTLLKTLSFFGLYKPSIPLNHKSRDPNRLWRVSNIDAFGSNLAFILYRCGDANKFLVLHQERPVYLPECGTDDYLCPLEILENMKLHDCNIEEMCKLTVNSEL